MYRYTYVICISIYARDAVGSPASSPRRSYGGAAAVPNKRYVVCVSVYIHRYRYRYIYIYFLRFTLLDVSSSMKADQ